MNLPQILPGMDLEAIVDFLVESDLDEDFCVSLCLDAPFVGALAAAGFLVMSARLDDGRVLLLPKHHAQRSVLDFSGLHEARSAVRLLRRYELRPNAEPRRILELCAQVHGDEWLTPPLRRAMAALSLDAPWTGPTAEARFVSFGLYRDGNLVAGDFGAAVGGVYTSYTGFRLEDSAGTVQLIATGRWLRDAGYAFWDLGMPLPYKYGLGARDLARAEFVDRFRAARGAALPLS